MPTTRSKYNFKQFEQVFQKLAHKIAIEAVTNLKADRITVKTFSSGQLSEVETADYHFRFYFSHLTFYYQKSDHPDHMDFDIEEKFYSTSSHCTKISFYSREYRKEDVEVEDKWGFKTHPVDHVLTDAEKQRRQNKIDKFLENLMKDADLKVEPRFSLNNYKK